MEVRKRVRWLATASMQQNFCALLIMFELVSALVGLHQKQATRFDFDALPVALVNKIKERKICLRS